MENIIRIGTRSSKLALWQTDLIAGLLQKNGFQTEILAMETKGDKNLTTSFTEIGTKGVFTEELEGKLNTGEIDIAVHSAKDMQTVLPEGLEIIAFTERENPCDVLISFDKDFKLGKNTIVGTSSTRRRAMLRHLFPGIEIKEARGNLQTRFRKLEEQQFQAMILAFAGVHRMGYDEHIIQKLPLNHYIPAVGQGSIAIEASQALDPGKKQTLRKILNHPYSETCLLAERAFLRKLEGGCSIPAFGLAELDGDTIHMKGGVISLDGKEIVREEETFTADNPEQGGLRLAEKVLGNGGAKILAEIKKER